MEGRKNMKELTRRDFLKFGGAGLAGVVTLPLMGRMALASPSTNFFTIGVIPDTQNYVDGGRPQPLNLNFFKAQTQYLAENASALNLRFVTHVGDVVQHGDCITCDYPTKHHLAQSIEWDNAVEALDILDEAGIPFGLCPGNHDYDNFFHGSPTECPPLVSTAPWWKEYFGSGSKYFQGKSWYGGASDEVGYISTGEAGKAGQYPPDGTPCNYELSSYQIFSGGGKKFLHISLEMESGDAAIAWAQKVINTHHGYATIVTTHSYLNAPAWGDNKLPYAETAQRLPSACLLNSPNGCNSSQEVWSKLIAPNNQIFLVLCGHAFSATSETTTQVESCGPGVSKGENIRIDKNNSGNPVYQILTDYQGNTALGSGGGDGWFRMMQFDMMKDAIHFYTVNAYESINTGQQVLAGECAIYSDGMSHFDQPAGFSDFSLAMPVQVRNSPAGALK
jgi:hypothetical protein